LCHFLVLIFWLLNNIMPDQPTDVAYNPDGSEANVPSLRVAVLDVLPIGSSTE
jgi:hypothetical protein